MPQLSGRANPKATEAWCKDHGLQNLQACSSLDGLHVSRLGWGTNSGEVKNIVDLKYESALPSILESGINLIDTSPAYRCQRSQQALGKALRKAVSRGQIEREELVLVTQAGWLAFDRKEEEPEPFLRKQILPELGLQESDFVGFAWSLHPDWIRYQYSLACRLLQVEACDVLLLSSPEIGLRRRDRQLWREELRRAFVCCESLRAKGAIHCWGIASLDGFRVDPQANTLLDLQELLELAREVGGSSHGLRVLQLPFSLGQLDLLNAKQRTGSLLQAIEAAGLSVLGALPLGQGQLTAGLPEDIHRVFGDLESDALRALEFARSAPALTSTLVGMKSREHLDENLRLQKRPPLATKEWRSLFGES